MNKITKTININQEKIIISNDIEYLRTLNPMDNPYLLIEDNTNQNQDSFFAKYIYIYEGIWNGDMSSLSEISEDYLNLIIARCKKIPLIITRTERLNIKELCSNDTEALIKIFDNDSQFIEAFFENKEDAQAIINDYHKMYEFYGYGIWGIFLDNALIGIAGFTPRESENSLNLELGYAILSEYRRNGFATEACTTIIQYAKNNIEFNKILINVNESNIPALKLRNTLLSLL